MTRFHSSFFGFCLLVLISPKHFFQEHLLNANAVEKLFPQFITLLLLKLIMLKRIETVEISNQLKVIFRSRLHIKKEKILSVCISHYNLKEKNHNSLHFYEDCEE